MVIFTVLAVAFLIIVLLVIISLWRRYGFGAVVVTLLIIGLLIAVLHKLNKLGVYASAALCLCEPLQRN